MSQPKYRKLPVGTLVVDARYQRELKESRVAKIARTFNPRQLGALEVSDRGDGTFAVFDGQHRLAALRELDLDTAPCLVHSGLTAEQEAELFVRMQDDRKAPSPIERFQARVFSGDEDAMLVDSTAALAGFTIGSSGDAGTFHVIKAVAALERVYKREGIDILSETLHVIHDLWGGDQRSTDGYLIEGLAQFLRRYGNRFGPTERERLRGAAPTVILRKALGPMQGGGSHARHAIEAEIRKVCGVRGRPLKKQPARPHLELVAA